jgi:hypothetical protein
MSNTTEEWEEDAVWLHRNATFHATEDDVDDFCERVAIQMSEGMDEASARNASLERLSMQHAAR